MPWRRPTRPRARPCRPTTMRSPKRILELAALPRARLRARPAAKADAAGHPRHAARRRRAAPRARRRARSRRGPRSATSWWPSPWTSGELWRDEADDAYRDGPGGRASRALQGALDGLSPLARAQLRRRHKIPGPKRRDRRRSGLAGADRGAGRDRGQRRPRAAGLPQAAGRRLRPHRGLPRPGRRVPGRRWRVDGNGWRVVADPPVRFVRAPGMLPLPEPTAGQRAGPAAATSWRSRTTSASAWSSAG